MENIKLEIADQVATLWLNRPKIHNAMNENMIDELLDGFKSLDADKSIRIIEIKGEGSSFSSGADLNYMKKTASLPFKDNVQDAMKLANLFYMIYSSPKFVISVVHGNVAGGANGISVASDMVIAARKTRFRFSELTLGLIPATISPYIINRCGLAKAKLLMLSSREFSAKEAMKAGLVDKIVSINKIEEVISEIKKSVLRTSPLNSAEAKRLFLAESYLKITPEVIQSTSESLAKARASEEAREGLNAFLQKRKPNWKSN